MPLNTTTNKHMPLNADPMPLLSNHEPHSMYTHFIPYPLPHKPPSVTPPILPPRPPPLLPPRTIKHLLPQLLIHLVMRLAQPRPQLVPTARPHRVVPRRHVPRKVLAARPARVQPRKQAHEAPHVRLLRRRRLGRVRGGDRVQERPAGAAEGFDVGRAVVWDGDGGFWGGGGGGLFGLRGPGGEGGAASAAGVGG